MNPTIPAGQQPRVFRLHWGIFVPVIFFAATTVMPLVAVGVFLQLFQKALGTTMPPLPTFLYVLPVAFVALIDLALFVGVWVTYKKSEVRLDSEKLSFETGYVFRRTGEIPLRNIESIFHSEPLLGRLFGYGSIQVMGKGGTPFLLPFLAASKVLHSELQAAVLPRRSSPPPPPAATADDSRYMPR
jgi:uncharacterized membrane protein YdbT with pleckstrin-like domain